MVDNTNGFGQIIQTSRGNLVTRLRGNTTTGVSAKALAFGEMFVHVAERVDNVEALKIKDLVTNSYIKTIFKGDLFAGNNNTSEVYFLGSGGSLKWGGILFSGTTYKEATDKAKLLPNHIFMYNGNNELYDMSSASTDTSLIDGNTTKSPGDMNESDPAQIKQLDRSYVAEGSSEWTNRINPGDLFFYSPSLDQIVVLHLSRSTDALTKINVSALVSDSMRAELEEAEGSATGSATDSTNYDLRPSTLKSFLDGPVRYYQRLVAEEGWTKTVAVTRDGVAVNCTINRDASNGTKEIIPGEMRLPNPVDGAIYYIPFSETETGYNRYKITQQETTDGVLLDQWKDMEFREGDLFLALPQTDGSVKFTVISLYGALLDKFRYEPLDTFARADEYATSLWADGIDTEYEGDKEYSVKHDNISDFIDRLFKTKVDVDPVTHKIISSQLPDFLLGAPKYMGHFGSEAGWSWENIDGNATAEDFARQIIQVTGNKTDWENIDSNEDDDDTLENDNDVDTLSGKVNDALKSGAYWIYQGDTVDLNAYPNIFHIDGLADDYRTDGDHGEVALEDLKTTVYKITGTETYYNEEGAVVDKPTGDIESSVEVSELPFPATTGDNDQWLKIVYVSKVIDIADTGTAISIDNLAEHLLNKGDWVIYNGESKKFEVIDNTSSFIGLLVQGIKLSGVVEFKTTDETLDLTAAWKSDNAGRTIGSPQQITNDIGMAADSESIVFRNEDKVFAADPQYLNSLHLPKISKNRSGTGNATLVNSRFELLEEMTATDLFRTGLAVGYPEGYKDARQSNLTKTSLMWHYGASNYDSKNDYVFADDFIKELLGLSNSPEIKAMRDPKWKNTTGSVKELDAVGFNFDWFAFMGVAPATAPASYNYSFSIKAETAPQLYLPSHSGVLVTDTYVNNGFTVIKGAIDALYEKIKKDTTSGHIDWLQTVRTTTEVDKAGKPRKEVYDSHVLQVVDENQIILKLFYPQDFADIYTEYDKDSKDRADVSIYRDLSTVAEKYHASVNYELGGNTTDANAVKTILNPSTKSATEAVENVLPNHSGILLNNNSVIDGGVWL